MRKDLVFTTIVTVLLIAVVFLFYQNQLILGKLSLISEQSPAIEQTKEERALEKLFKHTEMLEYKKEEAEIKELTEKDLVALKEKMPAVYGTASPGDFEAGLEGLLVVYDAKKDEIKKMFRLQEIDFN